jgi:hypothetical protein
MLRLLSREVGNNSKHIGCIYQVRYQLYIREDATRYTLHKKNRQSQASAGYCTQIATTAYQTYSHAFIGVAASLSDAVGAL